MPRIGSPATLLSIAALVVSVLALLWAKDSGLPELVRIGALIAAAVVLCICLLGGLANHHHRTRLRRVRDELAAHLDTLRNFRDNGLTPLLKRFSKPEAMVVR